MTPGEVLGRADRRLRVDKKRLLMLLLGAVVGLEFLENGMFVFAASHIVGGIDAAPREFAQVQALYAIGSMLMIVNQQSLSRRFGYRRYLTGSLLLFMLGAVASALSQGLLSLSLARLVQGVGGGALFTSSRILVLMLFGAKDRPRALKYFMLVLFGMSACAPLLAASLVDGVGWRWIFLGVVPLAAMAALGCWLLLPDALGSGGEPVRWAVGPLLLIAVALTLLQLALSQARYDLFAHPIQLALSLGGGAVLLGAFLVQQWHHESPLMRLRELKHPVYVVGLVLYFLHYLLSNAANYVFPIFAERALGLPLLTTGWLSTFSAAVSLLGAYAYIRLAKFLTRKKALMAVGAALMALAAFLFSQMPPGAPPATLLSALVAKGLFGVMLVLPVAGLTFRDLGDERFAHGYQSKNLMRQIAGSFSASIAAILLQDRQFANYAQLSGTVTDANPQARVWLDGIQAGLVAHGVPAGEGRGAAMAELARVVEQQALLISCEDLYRMIAVFALVTVAVVLLQKRLR